MLHCHYCFTRGNFTSLPLFVLLLLRLLKGWYINNRSCVWMDIQSIVMLKSVALLAAVAITLLLVHSLEAAPVALQHKVSIPLAHAYCSALSVLTASRCVKEKLSFA